MKRLHLFRKPKLKGQSMVEFALALPVFLLAVFGIIELSRFFLIYSSVYTASREAARYGASVGFAADGVTPHDQDCAGIQQVALDQGFFAGISNVTVQVQQLDENLNAVGTPISCPAATHMGDRILVQVDTTYQPILGILPSMPISASANRTIMKDIDLRGTPPPTLAPATPFPSATPNIDPQVIILDEDAPTDDGELILRNYTTGVKEINADVIDFNPDNRIHTWRLISGDSGNVSIQFPHSEDTVVNFSSSGNYRFELEVFDGQYTGSDTIWVFVNAPPIVSAGGPYSLVGTDGTVCADGSRFRLNGSASDPFGILGASLQYSWNHPFGTTFDPLAGNTLDPYVTFSSPGTYSFSLTANDGYTSTTSDPVSVPVNAPPVVSASVDDDVPDFPDYRVTLTGSAINPDGLPVPSEITEYLWEKVSGPGAVNFGDATAPETTATFSARGLYRIRLKASDGCEFGYSSNLTIHVNEIPVVDANTITNAPVLIIPGNSLTTTITGSVTDDGYPNDPVRLTHTWSSLDNVDITDPDALSTTITFPALNTSMTNPYTLRLTASDGWESAFDQVSIVNNTPPVANAGPDRTISATVDPVLNGSGTDINFPYQTLSYTWSRVSGTGTGAGTVSFSDESSSTPTLYIEGPNVRGTYVLQLTVSDGLASHSDQVTITKNASPVSISTVTSNLIKSFELASLDGKTSYDPDNLPVTPITYLWSKNSGPGDVTFSLLSATDDDPSASFSVPGQYVLTLRVYDGLDYGYSNVSVNVNAPPTVNAGLDQTVRSTVTSANLSGTASDSDGLPIGTLIFGWNQVSGPSASFNSSTILNPTVGLGDSGAYVFELRADDTWEVSADTVVIRKNALPLANAGSNQTFRKNTPVTIFGSGSSDDGYPNASLTYSWTVVSTPSNGNVIANPISTTPGVLSTAMNPSVSFDKEGTYVLRLQVYDGLEYSNYIDNNSSSDSYVTITVTN